MRYMGDTSPTKDPRGDKAEDSRGQGRKSPERQADGLPVDSGPSTVALNGGEMSRTNDFKAPLHIGNPRPEVTVPSLNLSGIQRQRRTKHHGLNSTVNASGSGPEMDPTREINRRKHDGPGMKSKPDQQGRNSSKDWAYLTPVSLKELAKTYSDSSTRQNAMHRVKIWVQDSNPPYEANPSPGVHTLMSSSEPQKKHPWLAAVLPSCCFRPNDHNHN
jgi:hypothetical protein